MMQQQQQGVNSPSGGTGTTGSPSWANPNQNNNANATTIGGISGTSIEQHESELFSIYSTLDEPVMETIMRDLRAIGTKLKIVLQPLDRTNVLLSSIRYTVLTTAQDSGGDVVVPDESSNTTLSDNDQKVIKELKDWDLWGPLILCLLLSIILSMKAPTNQSSLVFAAVFCAVWVGSTIVTINAQLLGSTISFFQSLCVLGYSIFPLTLSSLLIGLLKLFFHTYMWIDIIIISIGYIWSIRTSSVFISLYIKTERRTLALYPVIFFYFFMSWMILLF